MTSLIEPFDNIFLFSSLHILSEMIFDLSNTSKCRCIIFRYLKLQNGQPSENEGGGFPTYKEAAKYVILENVDDQDDEIWWTFANSYQW